MQEQSVTNICIVAEWLIFTLISAALVLLVIKVIQQSGTISLRIALLASLLLPLMPTVGFGSPQSEAPSTMASGAGEIEQPSVRSALIGRTWQLVEIVSMNDSADAPDDRELYTLAFKADGSVQIKADCNHGTGSWTSTAAGKLLFGQIAATQALCLPGSLHAYYMAQFASVRSYIIRDGHLFLATMADGSIIEFAPEEMPLAESVPGEEIRTDDPGAMQDIERRAFGTRPWEQVAADKDRPGRPASGDDVPTAAIDGGTINWEVRAITGGLHLRALPSTASEILATYLSGTVLDNLGCQKTGDRIWCDVQQFGGASRGYVAAKYLKPAAALDGNVPMGPETSSLRAGQGEFDATGKIPCAQHAGQPMRQCSFGVARQLGGFATVIVTKPDGVKRAIFFRRGIPSGADSSQADGYGEFAYEKDSDLNLIRVGEERYEIPDAAVLGG